jgi:DNA-binding MarR family transcriptional regulator
MKADATLAPSAFDLASRPGFLIRRLHQIHLALFAEECGTFNVTPVQYSILTAVASQPGLEQARLAYEVGVDRTTLANVVARLETRGLVKRRSSPGDKRLKRVMLTARGRNILHRMDGPARRAHERTVAALRPADRAVFLRSLAGLVDAGNDYGRAPLRLG